MKLLALLQKKDLKRFMVFLLVGGSALAMDMGLYWICTRWLGWPYLLSRACSLGVAIFWNFGLNRSLTFCGQGSSRGPKVAGQFVRFLVVIGSTSLLSIGLLHVGVAWFGVFDLVVIVFAAVLTTLINFFAHRYWTYADRSLSIQ